MTMARGVRTGTSRAAAVASALAVAVLVAGADAFAQQAPQPDPPRPQNARFRGAQPPRRDVLSLSTGLYGAYDEEINGDENGGGPRNLLNGGPYTGLDLGLTFAPAGEGDLNFTARGSSSLRYYPDLSDLVAATHDASASASYRVTRKVNWQARGGYAYTPYFDFAAAPQLDPTDLTVPMRIRDTAFSTRRIRTFDGGTDVTYAAGERTSMTVAIGMRKTNLLDEDQGGSTDFTAHGSFNRRFNRRTSSRITFVHRQGENAFAGERRPVRVDDLEIGLDRDWARSQTRRTTFSFTVGPSLVEHQSRQQLRAFGGVAVTHPFGESWNIRALYRRGITFFDGVPEPVFSDSMTVNLGGLVTRNLDVSMGVSAIVGEVGVETIGTAFDTYTGSMQARYALSRSLALYGEYTYQSHNYSGDTTGLPGQDRSGVRIGLTWYMPLLQEPESAPRPGPGARRGR